MSTSKKQVEIYVYEGRKFVRFTSPNLEECISFYKTSDYRYIDLNYVRDFNEENLDFLKGLKVEGILVNTMLIKDYSELLNHPELKFIEVSEIPSSDFDFNKLPNLEFFSGDWDPNYKNLSSAQNLKELTIGKYKSQKKDLTEFSRLEKLENLRIIQSNIKSCKGLETLSKLKKIGLAYNTALLTFTDTNKVDFKLEELEIQNCKKLDLNTLEGIQELKKLVIVKHDKVVTLEPILKKMPRLEKLQFTESELTDNDNRYLIKQPSLKLVWLTDKKKYQLNEEEINEALKNPEKKRELLKMHI